MSKFVVTGAHGYVATRLIRRLLADGHEVVGLTRGVTNVSSAAGYHEVSVGDYTDEALLIFALGGAQAVFHLAGRAHQQISGKDDGELFHAANVAPTVAIARASAKSGVARMVMVSSIGVLGNRTDSEVFSDSSIPCPVDLYAISKANAEVRMMGVLSDTDCTYCILRPPLVYGPGCPGNFAKLVAMVSKAPFIPLGGVYAPRTFIYVDHLVDSLVVAATHPAVSRRTFVVADDADTSVAEIVRIAIKTFGRAHWRVFTIPAAVLRMLSLLVGQGTKVDKLLTQLRVDGSGFQYATGWRPMLSTTDAIAATLKDWPATIIT